MATGAKTTFNFQTAAGKFNVVGQNSAKEMELTQDLHLKMSKKIAQLTKVIYALNTKIDENETIVTNIKEQHEEKLQSVLADTRNKIEHYRQKLLELKEETKPVGQKEELSKKYEEEKRVALEELNKLKKNAEQQELKLKAQHVEQLGSMSEHLKGVKKELEARLVQSDQLQERYRKEKENAVREVEEQYKKRLEAASQAQNTQHIQLESVKQELHEKHSAELNALQKKLELANTEKFRQQDDFDAKLSKAQAFYEKELDALKNSQNSSHEERYKTLTDSYEKLRKEIAFQDNLSKQRINELLNQLSLNEETTEKLKEEQNSLVQRLKTAESNVVQLNKELSGARTDLSRIEREFAQQKTEFASTKLLSEQQTIDIMEKSGRIAELEATTLQQTSTVKDLTAERDEFKQRGLFLESLRQNLEKNNMNQVEEQEIRLRTLQKMLDDLTKSKEELVEKYEEERKRMTTSAGEIQRKLLEDHRLVVDAAHQRHNQEMTTERFNAETKFTRMKQDFEIQLESETKRLERENATTREEMKQSKEDLGHQLSVANKEIERLEKLVQESQQGLGSVNSHLNSLREASDTLRAELTQTKLLLSESHNNCAALQKDYDSLKIQHDKSLKDAEVKLRTELQQLRTELDNNWKNQTKAECDRLMKELMKQKESDERATVERLMKLKEAELTAAKQGWEKKVGQLLDEITVLKKAHSATKTTQSEMMEGLRKQKDEELRQLRLEMLESAEEYERKVDSLKVMYTGEIETMIGTHKEQMKTLESEMRKRQVEELKTHVDAHKIVVAALRDDLEKEKRMELDAQLRQNQQDMEDLRVELEQRLASEIENLTYVHMEELQASRLELERQIEISKEKDGENAILIMDLKETVTHKDEAISKLQAEIKTLQEAVQEITGSLEQKGKDIVRLRKEASRTIKARESELQKRYAENKAALESSHLSQTQEMIREFSGAQLLLKEKITQLQDMLEEAEERYQNRESREEDIEKIRSLNGQILSKDEEMKKLIADKKYFQLELVNRETNFNKVFSSDPKVGLLNPLTVNKKPKLKDVPVRQNSSSSLVTRLNPLPGSPFHDEKLSNFKPLPPPVKKFLH